MIIITKHTKINSVKICLKFNSENDKNFKKYAIT